MQVPSGVLAIEASSNQQQCGNITIFKSTSLTNHVYDDGQNDTTVHKQWYMVPWGSS